MDRVVSVGCKSWLWVCHVMRRLPDPSIERNSRRFMLGLPHTGDRMGSSLRPGSDQSSWLTRAEVAVGSKSAPNRAAAASLVPLWQHSRKAGGGNDLNDVSIALEIRRAEDIAPAFEALKGRADALYVCNDPLVNTNRVRINTSALGARLPTVYNWRENVEAGGLMSYGTKLPGYVPAQCGVDRQSSARGQASRHPGRTADQIRPHHQPNDREGARARPPPVGARARRRGDRVKRRVFIALLSGAAAALPLGAGAHLNTQLKERKRHAPHRSHRHQSRRFGEGNQVL